jgi:hypothetical protein
VLTVEWCKKGIHVRQKNYSITLISLTLQNSTPAARLTTERQADKRKCESFGQMALMMTRSSCDNHFIPPSVQATPREGDSTREEAAMQMWCDDHLVYVQPAPALERDGGDHRCRPIR